MKKGLKNLFKKKKRLEGTPRNQDTPIREINHEVEKPSENSNDQIYQTINRINIENQELMEERTMLCSKISVLTDQVQLYKQQVDEICNNNYQKESEAQNVIQDLQSKLEKQSSIQSELKEKDDKIKQLEQYLKEFEFAKQSALSEVEEYKQIEQKRMRKIKKLKDQLDGLQEQNNDRVSQIYYSQIESQQKIQLLEKKLYIKKSRHKEVTQQWQQYCEQLNQNLQLQSSKLNESNQKLLNYQLQYVQLEEQVQQQADQLQKYKEQQYQANTQIIELKRQVKQLQDSLIKVGQKRQLAKQEVLKLSEELNKQQNLFSMPTPRSNNSPPKLYQYPDLNYDQTVTISTLLDNLYKNLMSMLANSYDNATISISKEQFNSIEHEVNTLIMIVRESLELQDEENQRNEKKQSMSARFISRLTNIKQVMTNTNIFACMPNHGRGANRTEVRIINREM